MVKIPEKIKEFIENQGVFLVGTVGGNRLPNVSPRIFFEVKEDSIYWLDFFKHKSYRNIQTNPWVTVAVFDKEELEGYQFRGTVSFITDEPTKSEIRESIIKKTLKAYSSPKAPVLVRKERQVSFSLNPRSATH